MVVYNNSTNRFATQFTVNSVPGAAAYSTIQDAINACTNLGLGGTIVIADGNYVEDLIITPNMELVGECQSAVFAGESTVSIQGSITFTGAGNVVFSGLELVDNGVSPVMDCTIGAGSMVIEINNCFIAAPTSQAIITGDGALINITNSSVEAINESIVLGTSNLNIRNNSFIESNSGNAINIVNQGQLGIKDSSIQASGTCVLISSTGCTFSSQNNYYVAIGGPCIDFGSTGIAGATFNDVMNSGNGSGEVISGTGTIVYANLTFQQGATISPTVTLDPSLANQGSTVWNLASAIYLLEGSESIAGVATLSSGTVTVNNVHIQSTSRVHLTRQDPNGSTTIGSLSVGTISAGSSFVINSLGPVNTVLTGDTSIVYWTIIQSTL